MIALGHLSIIFCFQSHLKFIRPGLWTLFSRLQSAAFLFRIKAHLHWGTLLMLFPPSHCSSHLSFQCLLTVSTPPKLPSNLMPSMPFSVSDSIQFAIFFLVCSMLTVFCTSDMLHHAWCPPSCFDLSPFRTKPLPNQTYVILTYSNLSCTLLHHFQVSGGGADGVGGVP